MGSLLPRLETEPPGGYVPKAQYLLQHIFNQHFPAFVDSYDERYAKQYGKFMGGTPSPAGQPSRHRPRCRLPR